MTPIERVRAKDAARAVLGVPAAADATEIRAAWRRAAFAAHPDRHGGDQSGFVRAKAAYDILSAGFDTEADRAAPAAATPTRTTAVHEAPRRAGPAARRTPRAPDEAAAGAAPRRPRIAERETPVPGAARAACLDRLAAGAAVPVDAHLLLHRDAKPDRSDAPADHVPHAVRRRGRAVTFVVDGPLSAGWNRVALPAGLLEGALCGAPQLLSITALRDGAGEVVVPEKVRARLFPGLREVRLRFERG
jgi:hypothetical protein